MADFVFGGIESDEQRLLQTERAARAGIRHCHDITPLDPAPGEPVRLSVQVGPDVAIDRLTAYVTLDGSQPAGAQGQAESGFAVALAPVATRWEPLIWDYVTLWQGEIPGQPAGTLVQYRLEGWRTFGAAAVDLGPRAAHRPHRRVVYALRLSRRCVRPAPVGA